MSIWDTYPLTYREKEVQAIVGTVRAGECISLVGLSGAGKSNLVGFLANRVRPPAFDWPAQTVLVDCNRLGGPTVTALFRLIRQALGDTAESSDEFGSLDAAVARHLKASPGLCLLLDRSDAFGGSADTAIFSNLRALRDAHKYELTYITASRRPLDPRSELAELFYAHTVWLGPLSESDARWSADQYAARRGQTWDDTTLDQIVAHSWGYPSLLRAVCEAHAEGAPLEMAALCAHPAVRRRVDEFWADSPTPDEVRRSGLEGHPLLVASCPPETTPLPELTAKEHLLLEHFRSHPGEICDKDALVRAVWPEDKIYARGIRDDSLAQLIRRLREKIEPDPSNPTHIQTVPGRGYRFT